MEEKGKALTIMAVAVALVAVLSLVAWEDVSGGWFKSFSLISDITGNKDAATTQTDYLDPDLALLEEGVDTTRFEYIDEPVIDTVSIVETFNGDDETLLTAEAEPFNVPTVSTTHEDAALTETVKEKRDVTPTPDVLPRVYGSTPFIDFSGGANIARLRKSLSDASKRTVRFAVVGDSYIEGDIFTQGVREALQTNYGGNGIGYTPLFSEIPGFRRSVMHSCENFEALDFRKKSERKYCLLPGIAMRAGEGAAATFNGTSKVPHADRWQRATLMFETPRGGSFKVRTEKKGEWTTYSFESSDSLHILNFNQPSSYFSISSITPGIIFQGLYLDGDKGIALDNMSIRGYAGIRHDEIDEHLTALSRNSVDYDVIVLEFGINALSASQTNYSNYANKMTEVVNHLKKIYPKATFIIMGIGDRGEKRGGEIHSMRTVGNMIDAQKEIAKATKSLFYDTRIAMGGEDAVVDWVKNGEINKDYIHLSFKGGKTLAEIFYNDLEEAIK